MLEATFVSGRSLFKINFTFILSGDRLVVTCDNDEARFIYEQVK